MLDFREFLVYMEEKRCSNHHTNKKYNYDIGSKEWYTVVREPRLGESDLIEEIRKVSEEAEAWADL